MMMVQAGSAVDDLIAHLVPYLEAGDLLMDGGNAFFLDTERRSQELDSHGVYYLGVGISGGEEGALWGPSIMPGGHQKAYVLVEPILKAIAAKVEEPCVAYIGPRGSGHFVKMVHNGIEYADMQLIAESYDLLRRGPGLCAAELHSVFGRWNEDELSSYLMEITADIFASVDAETGQPTVDLILDQAEQKGTGRWTVQTALDLGVATPTINAAVEERIISACKGERERAAEILTGSHGRYSGDREKFIDAVGHALYTAKICSYAQGFALLRAASHNYEYDLEFSEIARVWRNGCIIRARFLDDVRAAYTQDPELPNLLLAPFFRDSVNSNQAALRRVVGTAAELGIPAPAMSASLAYYDSYRSAKLPANLLQAQRDYFGAHTCRRLDHEGIFHMEWVKSINRDNRA
jgi:6-phosphogluconate dehydrogenase